MRRDAVDVPMEALHQATARLPLVDTDRQGSIAKLLLDGAPQAVELWLREFITRTQRQIGGHQALGPTFVKAVEQIDEDVLEALPQRTRAALKILAGLADDAPVRLGGADLLAHALCIDGRLVAWLHHQSSGWRQPLGVPAGADYEEARAAYQRARSKAHPDKGGDVSEFRAIKAAWHQALREYQ
jgi:hypothetical protein